MKQDPAKLRLFLAHRTALIDYATPIVGDHAQAEDVVQEAWLRFEGTESRSQRQADTEQAAIAQPAGYLYRIVRNLALDWLRKLASERRSHRSSFDLDSLTGQMDGTTPEATILHRDTLRLVAAAMAELPERNRLAFEMHRFGGCTFQEIAERMGISLGLAHKLVRDAVSHCAARSLQQPAKNKTAGNVPSRSSCKG
ncbi:MAG: sigma-70 family RNA polymerase sigma factor [Oceanibaculum nanhaiense]|uniref:sigma-70 family RNA polymerase sigma factor n=1 Tax=Oceanibaculum nanhaiense TaxID=1909734 RepID=UPI0032ED66A3